MAGRFPEGWAASRGPFIGYEKVEGQSRAYADVAAAIPRLYCRVSEDFDGAPEVVEVDIPMFSTTDNAAIIPDSIDDARGYVIAPVTGVLVGAQFVGENGLAVSDSNFVTFTLTNLGDGNGDTEMLEDSEANSTTTDGSAITALSPRSLTISQEETNEALRVAAGDVLRAKATVDGTLANTIACPVLRVQIQTMPSGCRYTPIAPLNTWTGMSAFVGPLADEANGVVSVELGENDLSAVTGGWAWNDQLLVPGDKGCIFQCRAKIGSLVSGERVVIGLMSAYNATLDSTTRNLWFRMDGSLAVKIEGDDNTTNTDDLATGFTLDADTWYWFTINASDPAAVTFWIDEQAVGTVAVTAISSGALQPTVLLQKDALITDTPDMSVDYIDVMWRRV